MGLKKNTAGQRWRVFAFNRKTNAPVVGDAANITAKLRKDWGALAPTNTTNPTEIEDGFYDFPLTQAESNGDWLDLFPESATTDVQVVGVPGGMATSVQLDMQALATADVYVDKSGSPWQLVWMQRGTGAPGVGTELMRKNLADVDGNPLTDIATPIGRTYE
jgi:hypothetical protein